MIDFSAMKRDEKEAITEFERRVGHLIPPEIQDDKTVLYRFLKDCLKCCTINEGVKHFLWYCEKAYIYVKERNKVKGNFGQGFIIINLDKLTLSNTTSKLSAEMMLRLLHLFQDNYPEVLKCAFVINDGWKEKLLSYIDADVLPEFLGGKRTDPDGNPMCNTFVVHGGKVPDCYHLSSEDRYFKDKSQIIQLLVPPSSKREIYLDVLEESSIIYWEFFVKTKDIGFGLFFKESDQLSELLPIQKYDTVDGIETGFYRAKSLGK